MDDYLIAGSPTPKLFQDMEKELYNTFRWGKWEDSAFGFAGCLVKQLPDGSIMLAQEVDELRGLRRACPKVHIGYEERTVFRHQSDPPSR